jgi:hypothetical protein
MREVVRQVFYAFNKPMEGDVPWFYQDVKGLVSIGVGLLCDPIQLAMNLPMVHPDGTPAARDEIAAEWMRIKSLPPNAKGQTAAQLGHLYAKPHTRLRLTQEGLEQTLLGKLHQMNTYLAKRFDSYEAWPADAQLGVLSLSWACGPAFRFPRCEVALRSLDFRTAAVECFMPEERTISGLRPRNRVNRQLFCNAAIVHEQERDPDVLYWPRDLLGEEETQPDLVPGSQPDEIPLPQAPPPRRDTIVPFPIVHPRVYVEPDDPDDAA